MIEKINISDLDSISFAVKDEDEDEDEDEIKSNKECLKDDEEIAQLELILNTFKEKNFDDNDISISDINEYDKMHNVSNETFGKINEESDKNSIKKEFANNSLQEIVEINSMNYSRLEHSMGSMYPVGYFNDKNNLTYSQFLDFSSFIENPRTINTLNHKIKRKNKNNNFIAQKRKFNIDYPKDFLIFGKGEKDNNIRQYIEKIQYSKKSKDKILGRKNMADNIRKKVKTKFLNSLRIKINEKLRIAGSNKFFGRLPQKFIHSVTKKLNKEVQDFTIKEIFSKCFCDEDDDKGNDPNLNNYKWNISVLKYLEEREAICEKSNYHKFINLKWYQIFSEYLRSKEFEQEILNLKRKNETNKYIEYYIQLAYNLNNYFYQ